MGLKVTKKVSKFSKEVYLAAFHEVLNGLVHPDATTILADVKDLPDAYLFFIDMPGVGSGEIKVEMEDDRVLVISGERKREGEEMYKKTERWMGTLMRKFQLAENANTNAVSAVWHDGVLTVTVEKLPEGEVGGQTLSVERPPPPVPTKLKRFEVKFA